jgi:hypothetical protein
VVNKIDVQRRRAAKIGKDCCVFVKSMFMEIRAARVDWAKNVVRLENRSSEKQSARVQEGNNTTSS